MAGGGGRVRRLGAVLLYTAVWVLVGTLSVACVYFADAAESWATEERRLAGFVSTFALALILGCPVQIVAALCARVLMRFTRDALVSWAACGAALGVALPWAFARAGYALEAVHFARDWQSAKSALMFPLMGPMMYETQPAWVMVAVGATTAATVRWLMGHRFHLCGR